LRRIFAVGDLPEEEETVEAIRRAEMDPRHAHLDELAKRLDAASLPKPEPGFVICYSLWLREPREGRKEGTQDRPCAIILAARDQDGWMAKRKWLSFPSHTARQKTAALLSNCPTVKQRLGLDAKRSQPLCATRRRSRRQFRRLASR
jgi:hypothetical protein